MNARTQKEITPELALDILKEGNLRFTKNLRLNRNLLEEAENTSNGQHPFAVVLSCIDSRTSAELIFDQGIGDIFSIRIAGNIVNNDIMGSLEFACKFAGSKLIVVLGHTGCGAIQGAFNNVEAGNLTGVLSKIKPAIENVRKNHKPNSEYSVISNDIIRENVLSGINNIQHSSDILSELIEKKEVKIIGGIHNISNGQVKFFEPEQTH
jgi:carbonic anhydrase